MATNDEQVAPSGYALRYRDRSCWIGIWNRRETAEHVKEKMGNKGIEVVPVCEAEKIKSGLVR